MRIITKCCSLVLVLELLSNSGFAAGADPETVTVTGRQPDRDTMAGDLDPTNTHFHGLTGEQISRDIDPLDRESAFREFARGLSGPLGESYDWHGLRDDGRFRATREFREAGLLCRDFTEETSHRSVEALMPETTSDGGNTIVMGTACREPDGWYFR
jgi:surface antigen